MSIKSKRINTSVVVLMDEDRERIAIFGSCPAKWCMNRAPCPLYPPNAPPLMECVTQGSTPFRFNLHVRDLGHALMFGPTRSGKSTHLGLISAQLRRYPGMMIYVFDKGMSIYPLTRAIGANHFTVAGDEDRLTFCPLQFLQSRSDRARAME